MNAIESERDLCHCSSQHGGILGYRMRRYQRPHQIPWDYNYAIDRLHRKRFRSFVFYIYSRCGRLERKFRVEFWHFNFIPQSSSGSGSE
jgi:hypothetical protein